MIGADVAIRLIRWQERYIHTGHFLWHDGQGNVSGWILWFWQITSGQIGLQSWLITTLGATAVKYTLVYPCTLILYLQYMSLEPIHIRPTLHTHTHHIQDQTKLLNWDRTSCSLHPNMHRLHHLIGIKDQLFFSPPSSVLTVTGLEAMPSRRASATSPVKAVTVTE